MFHMCFQFSHTLHQQFLRQRPSFHLAFSPILSLRHMFDLTQLCTAMTFYLWLRHLRVSSNFVNYVLGRVLGFTACNAMRLYRESSLGSVCRPFWFQLSVLTTKPYSSNTSRMLVQHPCTMAKSHQTKSRPGIGPSPPISGLRGVLNKLYLNP